MFLFGIINENWEALPNEDFELSHQIDVMSLKTTIIIIIMSNI